MLQARSGFIGARCLPTTEENLHALALKDATKKILSSFASPEDGMPFASCGRTKYTKLLDIIMPRVELLCADGASDEQLALDFMFGIFPGLKVASRDLCHSVRRVASRTCIADPYCKKVFLERIHEIL